MLRPRIENKATMPQCPYCGSTRLVCLDCHTLYRRGRQGVTFCTNADCRGSGEPLRCLTCGKAVTDEGDPIDTHAAVAGRVSIGCRMGMDTLPYKTRQHN